MSDPATITNTSPPTDPSSPLIPSGQLTIDPPDAFFLSMSEIPSDPPSFRGDHRLREVSDPEPLRPLSTCLSFAVVITLEPEVMVQRHSIERALNDAHPATRFIPFSGDFDAYSEIGDSFVGPDALGRRFWVLQPGRNPDGSASAEVVSPTFRERDRTWIGMIQAALGVIRDKKISSGGGVDLYVSMEPKGFPLSDLKRVVALFHLLEDQISHNLATTRGDSFRASTQMADLDKEDRIETIFRVPDIEYLRNAINGRDQAPDGPDDSDEGTDSRALVWALTKVHQEPFKVALPHFGNLVFSHHVATLDPARICDWALFLLDAILAGCRMTNDDVRSFEESGNVKDITGWYL